MLTSRRSASLLVAVAYALSIATAPATAAPACTAASEATYRHSFDGAAGSLDITSVRPLCGGQTQVFSLVSYTATPGEGQFVHDTSRATITAAARTVVLKVSVPGCAAQVAGLLGAAVVNETTTGASPYGSARLGSSSGAGARSSGDPAWWSGGAGGCEPAPTVTFASSCTGTLTATLANRGTANVTAVFLTGDRLLRLAPGDSTTLTAPRGTTISIRASDFTTYVGNWRTPASGCETPAAPTATPPAAPTSTPRAVSPGVPTARSEPASSSATEPPAPAPGGGGVGGGLPVATTPPATALTSARVNPASLLAILLGVLMVVGGSVVLVRVIRASRDTD